MPSKFLPSFEGSSTKEVIIEILAEQWPLTGIKLFPLVNKCLSKPITKQALHKALSHLVELGLLIKKNKEYELSSKWLFETLDFCHRTLEAYEDKKPKKTPSGLARVKIYDSRGHYKAAAKCLQNTKEIRVCSRTSIFLKQEQETNIFRKKYSDIFLRLIASDQVLIKYILSSDLTKKSILEKKDRVTLDLMKCLLQKTNLSLKCADSSKMSPMVLTDKDLFFGINSPLSDHCIAWVHITGTKVNEVKEVYDAIFENLPNAYDLIIEIEKELE